MGNCAFKNTLWEFINKDDPHIGYSFKPAIENGLKLSFVWLKAGTMTVAR